MRFSKSIVVLSACGFLAGLCGMVEAETRATVDGGLLFAPQNYPPETYIHLDTLEVIRPNFVSPQVIRNRKYYSLPEPTATYDGIAIGWLGSDSIDYPGEQPPFEFNWVLFGPYPDSASTTVDSAKLLRTNDDPGTPQVEWTDQNSTTFADLRSGWYLFWVRSRDDSMAVDPTPATARFQVVEPSFHKPFMLLDATNWKNGQLINAGAVNFRDPRSDSLLPDTIIAMYDDLFSGHGYSFDPGQDSWHRQMDMCEDCYDALPDRDILGQYKAVIVYDEDMQIPLDRDNRDREYETFLGEYLDVGGRVVLIGRNLFASSVDGWTPGGVPQDVALAETDFGFRYFGATSMYFPHHINIALMSFRDSSNFLSAVPVDPPFPAVATDTLRTIFLSQVPIPEIADRTGDGLPNWLWVPDVNWIVIDSSRGVAGIYQFNSAFPGASPSHGQLCGARYEFYDPILGRHTFRTAIVTFPLFPLTQDSNLRALARELLDYILAPASPTDVAEGGDAVIPRESGLLQNYPNPFNAGTTVRFTLDVSQRVTVSIFNVMGRKVCTLVDDVRPAGIYEIAWNGRGEWGREVGSGVYFCRLQLGNHSQTRKLMLLK